jgi:hypothetical protein
VRSVLQRRPFLPRLQGARRQGSADPCVGRGPVDLACGPCVCREAVASLQTLNGCFCLQVALA